MALTEIKKISLIDGDHALCDEYARKRLEGLSTVYSISCEYSTKTGDTYVDWDDGSDVTTLTIKNASFKSTADEIIVSRGSGENDAYLVLTSTASANKYYVKKMAKMQIGDTIYVIEASSTASDRWLSAFTESPLSGTFKALNEKIDLSEYAKKTEAGKAGTYTSSSAGEGATGSAGSQTATGSVTVTYAKADATTGSAGSATVTAASAGGATITSSSAGGATVNFSNATFTGTAATLTAEVEGVELEDHSYTPAGTVALTPTAASTISINDVSGATLNTAGAATVDFTNASFSGTAATISISGSVTGTAVGDHAAATLSVSGSQTVAAHSHTVNAATDTVTAVTEINGGSFTFTEGTDAFTANVPTAIDTTKFNGGTFTQGSKATFTQGAKASLTYTARADVMSAPTVNASGVLSWTLTTADDITAWSANGDDTFTANGDDTFTAAAIQTGFYTAGSAASFTQGTATYSYTPASVKSTKTCTYVTGATLATAGGVTISGTNFSAALPSLTHSVTQGSVSGSTTYTPAGSITGSQSIAAHSHAVNIASTAKTVAIEGIKSMTAAFTGTTATISHSFTEGGSGSISINYTPEGTISGTQTIDAHTHSVTVGAHTHSVTIADHTHSISTTDTSATGSASVAVSAHTHSIGNHTHNVTVPNCAS